MRIGIDASCWANQRGYGRYTRELLRALLALDQRNEYLLFIDRASALQANDLPAGVEQVRVETSQAATQAASASGRRSLRDLWAMRQAVHQHGRGLDLFYFPSVYTFFLPKTSARVIVTIHDTTAERYPRLIFPNWRSRLFWKVKVQLAVRRADLIATVSEASKRAIMKEFRVSEERVRIISDAVGAEFCPIKHDPQTREVIGRYGVNSDEPFILYVGGISPHKNLGTLVEAHARLLAQPDLPRANLVLVGDYQKDVFYSSYTDLQARIQPAGTGGSVIFTGFVDDSDLAHFYSAAAALVMPSYDEGFGLPALEAMACGAPVVASQAGALSEVVGEAGCLFNPHSPDELKDRLARLLKDPEMRDGLSRQGLQRAKEFSWEHSARQALAIFEGMVQGVEPAVA